MTNKEQPTLLTAEVIALYKPPFRYEGGYIWDADGRMVSDRTAEHGDSFQRVRGWGRLSHLPNAAKLQDAIGERIADILTQHWLDTNRAHVIPAGQGEVVGWRYRDTSVPWDNRAQGWTVAWQAEEPQISWTCFEIEPVYLHPTPAPGAGPEVVEALRDARRYRAARRVFAQPTCRLTRYHGAIDPDSWDRVSDLYADEFEPITQSQEDKR